MTPRELSTSYGSEIIVRRWIGCWIDFIAVVGVLLAADGLLGNELYQKTLFVWLGICILYFPVLETATGRTLGKLVSGTVVVDERGATPSFGKVIIRTLLRLFEVNPFLAGGIPAGLVANFSKTHQRLGDMAADTYVVLRRDLARVGALLACVLFVGAATAATPEATVAARKWLEASGTPLTADEFAKAAGACDVEKVKLFVAAGIGEAERQKALDYRLAVATTNSRCDDVVSQLARSGVKLNGDHLLEAVIGGQRDTVSIVVGSGVDVNYAASDGSTAAITAARVRNMGAMELLRDRGADLNRAEKKGTTPLMVATDLGDLDMVRFLLATPRLDVNHRDSAGETALHMARLSRSARRLPQVRWDALIDVLEKAGATE